MDEMFQFQGGPATNSGNLIQRQLAGQHPASEPHPFQHFNSSSIMNSHLGRSMELQTGEMLFSQFPDCQILQDNRIDTDFFQSGKGIDQLR